MADVSLSLHVIQSLYLELNRYVDLPWISLINISFELHIFFKFILLMI